jgi:membrane protein
MDAVNIFYDEKEKRGFIKLNLVSLAIYDSCYGICACGIGAVVVVPLILTYIGRKRLANYAFPVTATREKLAQ